MLTFGLLIDFRGLELAGMSGAASRIINGTERSAAIITG